MSETQKRLAITDAENYRRLCEPFENNKVASDATHEFFQELYELRNKHKLPDVHVIIRCAYLNEEGWECIGMLTQHCGDVLHTESMCAWAYGQAAKERQQMIGKLAAGMNHKVRK